MNKKKTKRKINYLPTTILLSPHILVLYLVMIFPSSQSYSIIMDRI